MNETDEQNDLGKYTKKYTSIAESREKEKNTQPTEKKDDTETEKKNHIASHFNSIRHFAR